MFDTAVNSFTHEVGHENAATHICKCSISMEHGYFCLNGTGCTLLESTYGVTSCTAVMSTLAYIATYLELFLPFRDFFAVPSHSICGEC